MKGKVKWFNVKKGYGFITGEDNIDYFVHHSNVKMEGYRKLSDGQSVEFDPSKNEKGNHAVEVQPLDVPPTEERTPRKRFFGGKKEEEK